MLKRLRASTSRRGAVLIFAALLLVPLLFMAAISIDLGYICCVKTEAQAVADAASMAGAKGLPFGAAEVRTRALACAALNKANGQAVQLQNADVEIGQWNDQTQTFTPLGGADEADGSAVRVTVSLTGSRNSSPSLFFGNLFGTANQDVVATAIAGGLRWDVVLAQDVTGSYADELHFAVEGDQYALDSLYKYAPWASFGVVQFTGWGSTVAPLQVIRNSYTTTRSRIGAMVIGTGPWSGGAWPNGGNGTTVGVTPPASGTDLAAGLQQALLLFNASTYNPPPGTRKAIVISTDGISSPASNGSHPGMSAAQMLTLAQQVADQAWAQGISVFAVLYDDGTDANAAAVQSLVRGQGVYVRVTQAPYLPAAMQAVVTNDMLYSLLK